jgi:hypothetical protein
VQDDQRTGNRLHACACRSGFITSLAVWRMTPTAINVINFRRHVQLFITSFRLRA